MLVLVLSLAFFAAGPDGGEEQDWDVFVGVASALAVLVGFMAGGMFRSMLMSESESMASKHDQGDGEGGGARTLIAWPKQCLREERSGAVQLA